ncbi:unnamed protein product [Cuscuta epithymum]|uniref:Uncharacterized protein n=1 Tax=Cuscuta epithymum TaxID=186058 RepID=A0AAV0DE42_9ASTE|nr:unnamed protein product [Cuscuta epithymum]
MVARSTTAVADDRWRLDLARCPVVPARFAAATTISAAVASRSAAVVRRSGRRQHDFPAS